jgi:hypothetical protein
MTDQSKELMRALYEECNLVKDDVFKHKHYVIITRSGIEKIQAARDINITYEVLKCEDKFCALKATGIMGDKRVETLASATYGVPGQTDGKFNANGTTTSWYIAEMAEKRAMSRVVLKLTGMYQHGVFGEDEADDFKKSNNA